MKVFPIAEPRQIRALASSTRQDIVDTVAAIGPCSVAELARALGRPADGLYYHIRVLKRVGLLVEEEDNRGRGELRIDVRHKAMRLKYDPADGRNRAAVARTIGSILRSAERAFRRGYRDGVAVVDGPRRNLWAGRTRGDLSQRELEEVNRLLQRLVRLMHAGRHDVTRTGRGKRQLYEVSFVLTPVIDA